MPKDPDSERPGRGNPSEAGEARRSGGPEKTGPRRGSSGVRRSEPNRRGAPDDEVRDSDLADEDVDRDDDDDWEDPALDDRADDEPDEDDAEGRRGADESGDEDDVDDRPRRREQRPERAAKEPRRAHAQPRELPVVDEDKINAPDRQTLWMLGVLAGATIFMWGMSRAACNYSPPIENRSPREVTLQDLAATAKDGAVELGQRMATYDFSGALELAKGALADELKTALAACRADPHCSAKRDRLAQTVLTTGELMTRGESTADVRVTTHGGEHGTERQLFTMERDGNLWKGVARIPAPETPDVGTANAPAAASADHAAGTATAGPSANAGPGASAQPASNARTSAQPGASAAPGASRVPGASPVPGQSPAPTGAAPPGRDGPG